MLEFSCQNQQLQGKKYLDVKIFVRNFNAKISSNRGVLGKYTDTTDPLHRPNYFVKLEKYTELPKYRINTQTILIHSLTKKLQSF